MSLPATKIWPLSGSSSLFSRRRNVDLPDPDGPTRNTNSPFWMSQFDLVEREDLALVDLRDVLELDHGIDVLQFPGGRAEGRTAGINATTGSQPNPRASPSARTTRGQVLLSTNFGRWQTLLPRDELVESET